jgi:hypothetical protein
VADVVFAEPTGLIKNRLNSRKSVRAELNDARADDSIHMGSVSVTKRASENGWAKSRPLVFTAAHPAEVTVHKADLASRDV